MERFCIRKEYLINSLNVTLDEVSDGEYWTPERIMMSYRYQYYVYREAHNIAKKYNLKTIVDVGCGVATKLNSFFGGSFDIYGIDQPQAIKTCQKLYKYGKYMSENFEGPTAGINKIGKNIDLLICSDVIEHLIDPGRILNFIKGITTNKSIIVISTPERNALLGQNALRPANIMHIREWSYDEFEEYIKRSGFVILSHKVLLPFEFKFNKMTILYILKRLARFRPLKTNQVVICKKVD